MLTEHWFLRSVLSKKAAAWGCTLAEKAGRRSSGSWVGIEKAPRGGCATIKPASRRILSGIVVHTLGILVCRTGRDIEKAALEPLEAACGSPLSRL